MSIIRIAITALDFCFMAYLKTTVPNFKFFQRKETCGIVDISVEKVTYLFSSILV